jgi:hypothetical protein
MQRINVWPDKKGFEILDPTSPVIINDNRGVLFYSTAELLPRITKFNLPPFGNYFVEAGSFQELDKPVDYPKATLPQLIRRFPDPFDFDIEFARNDAKCTIVWGQNKIVFDTAFKTKPLPEVWFILCHEFAHAFFNGGTPERESLADQMAGNYMLARGFNPEQIKAAPITSLSERQWQRKVNMVDAFQKSSYV